MRRRRGARAPDVAATRHPKKAVECPPRDGLGFDAFNEGYVAALSKSLVYRIL